MSKTSTLLVITLLHEYDVRLPNLRCFEGPKDEKAICFFFLNLDLIFRIQIQKHLPIFHK